MKWQGLGPTEPVRTEGGDLVGMLRRALDGIDRVGAAGGCGDVRAYFGIPYAAPPTGEARWCPPRPAAPWGGLRAAQAPAAQCVQPPRRPRSVYAEYSGDQPMSEDCLTLNVFSAAEPGEALPVMVWIHGGGHRQGAATNPVFTDGSLPCRGVVLVTINYRLGPLGFLCHPELMAESEHGACGNYALLDQIAALQWVSRNIAAFGGDPGCVTIFGQSAGGEAVGMLMASPLARGLFHRAGIMSLGATRTPQRAATEPSTDAGGANGWAPDHWHSCAPAGRGAPCTRLCGRLCRRWLVVADICP
ncbi:MAG: carboxylesterase family protein [Burkholderiaceae bacterium]